MKKSLVIIPTYNEKENVASVSEKALQVDSDLEILFIDDNSPDGTGKILDDLSQKEPRIHVIHRSCRMGLGTAYVEGFKYAIDKGFEYVLEMDADGQHDPKYITELISNCDENDLVIGSRYKGGIRFFNITLARIILATLANKYIRFITGMDIADSTSGLRCYKRKVLEAIDLDAVCSKGFAFQIEMAYRTWKKGFKIFELPIIFYNRDKGTSKMSRHIVFEAFFMVLRLKLKVR